MLSTTVARRSRTARLAVASFLALAAFTGAFAKTGGPRSTPPVPAQASEPAVNVWAALSLTDQDGRRVTLESLKGNTVLLNFIFTQCGNVCPLQTRQLVELAKAIPAEAKEHIRFVSVSVDPEHDTPQRLKAYAHAVGADQPHWFFLTGTAAEIGRTTTTFRAFDQKKANPGPGDHTTSLILIDRNGLPMQRYHGVPVDVPRLAREIQVLDQLRAAEARPATGEDLANR